MALYLHNSLFLYYFIVQKVTLWQVYKEKITEKKLYIRP